MSTRGNGEQPRAAALSRHGMRALSAGAVMTASLLAVAGPAHADTNVGVAGEVLRISGGSASDDITVTESDGRLIVTNTGDIVIGVSPCVSVKVNQVSCPGAGVTTIAADTGGGNNTLRNQTALRSRMGSSADVFFGGGSDWDLTLEESTPPPPRGGER
jgi:hypothetical protein